MDSAAADQIVELSNGTRICCRIDGSPGGETVVLIAGLGQQLIAWPQALVDRLVADGYQVVRLDNRDAGRSSRSDRPAPGKLQLLAGRVRPDAYALEDMAADIVDLLDRLEIERAHLVGQSMGGMIAQVVAASAPAKVASLTSFFSTTGDPKVGQPNLRTKLLLTAPTPSTRERAVAGHLRMARHLQGRVYGMDTDHERAHAAEAWDRADGADPDAMARQIQAILASGDRTASLRTISVPTLVIHGDRDPIVDPSGGRATAAAIPGARHVTIAGMGHHLAPGLIERYADLITRNAQGAHA